MRDKGKACCCNSAIASSWRVYVRQQIRPGRLTDVTITDTEIAYTYSTVR
jgi:hypothetical protein